MYLCMRLYYLSISQCNVSDIIRSEYDIPWRDDVQMLSECATTIAGGKRINYVETLSSVFSKRPTLSFVGAPVYDVAAVGIMRLTRDYTIVEILRGRSRTAAACFSNAAIGPAKLGGSLSTEHEVEIRFFPRGARFIARAYLAIKP